jgi:hypothetical protein
MNCLVCEEPSSDKFCEFCLKYNNSRIRNTKPKKIYQIPETNCITCNKRFRGFSIRQIYCCESCKPPPKTSMEKWLSKKPKEMKFKRKVWRY